MTGGVDEVNIGILPGQADAGGLHGDAPPLLHGETVGMSGALIHAARLADRLEVHQQLLERVVFPAST